MITSADVRRLDLGYFIRPAVETGTGEPRVEPVLAYAVRLPVGYLLFDTGMGAGDAEVDAHYRPHRQELATVLSRTGVAMNEVSVVVNCHLHFDHCGGNPLFTGRPIYAQRNELAEARTPDYTMLHLVDFDGADHQPLDGEAELFPGIWVIPTPGHTSGHQSLVLQCDDGTVILAGQAHDFASDYASSQLARRAQLDGAAEPLPVAPRWIERLQQFDPRRVLFAHDLAVWEP